MSLKQQVPKTGQSGFYVVEPLNQAAATAQGQGHRGSKLKAKSSECILCADCT